MSQKEHDLRIRVLKKRLKLARAKSEHASLIELEKNSKAGVTKKDVDAMAEHVKHRERQVKEVEAELEDFLAKR